MKVNKDKFLNDYKNLRVLVTGSTGFKGSWLCYWLNNLGAKVYGIGLRPEKNFYLFNQLKLSNKINQFILDISNFRKLNQIVKKIKPDIIFHLAAQSVVSDSILQPIKTINTNVLGSANILEVVKRNKINSLVYITSDKCYLNNNTKKNFKEKDQLGGVDIYSSSKASAEIIFYSYHQSYYRNYSKLSIASARAGNVIGGGDFKHNRIIPDFYRSIKNNNFLYLRNPNSTRPWQHVLDPLSGYMKLGSLLLNRKLDNNLYPSWNFAPESKNCKSVIDILDILYDLSKKPKKIKLQKNNFMYESILLSLNINKSKKELNWFPKLSLRESLKLTIDWYLYYLQKKRKLSIENFTSNQIERYLDL